MCCVICPRSFSFSAQKKTEHMRVFVPCGREEGILGSFVSFITISAHFPVFGIAVTSPPSRLWMCFVDAASLQESEVISLIV